ncbi:hypothetical protein [Paenibacillus sp. J2TS4]|uniref:hypothetical protein n=1 Tax=Paenibacillus sp. J2TS4 TaxID=2807194 RepID=UPI001B26D757|nr:hypothetical protein [Paenibacillus sp. J2TS4]GIP31256.1 hypothetical protein J2TS4_04660 [Paenibacillus sp. J2TS4]
MKALEPPHEDHRDQVTDHIKQRIQNTSLPVIDFTGSVMERIRSSSLEGTARPAALHHPRKLAFRAAIIVCAIAVMSGFSYAILNDLMLKDDQGQTAMEVRKASDMAEPPEIRDILAEVRTKLEPGESATVFIGTSQEEISEGNSEYIYGTTRPYEFASLEELYDNLDTPYADLPQPPERVAGYTLRQSFLLPGPTDPSSDYIFGDTSLGGLEYAYIKGKSEGVNGLQLQYAWDDKDLAYVMNISEEMMIYYDSAPSADSVIKLEGIEAYWSRNGELGAVRWSQKSGEMMQNYTVVSSSSSQEELISFAKEMIRNNAR